MEKLDKQAFREMDFKKKCGHIWYYFKIPIIIVVVILIVLAFTLHQCMTNVNPDITIHIVTKAAAPSTEQQDEFESYISGLIKDSNKDGKKVADCEFLSFDSSDPNVVAAYTSRLVGDMQIKDDVIYIFDDSMLTQLSNGDLSGFENLNDLVPGENLSDPHKLPIADTALSGKSFASSLNGTSILVQKVSTKGKDQKYIDRINNEINLVKTLAKK